MNQRHSLVAGTTDEISLRAWQPLGLHTVNALFCFSSSCFGMGHSSLGSVQRAGAWAVAARTSCAPNPTVTSLSITNINFLKYTGFSTISWLHLMPLVCCYQNLPLVFNHDTCEKQIFAKREEALIG